MKGFTLIELLISIVIFSFLLLTLGSLIGSVTKAEFRALAIQKLADNMRVAMETMGREMRLAQKSAGTCGVAAGESFKIDTPGPSQGEKISFIDFSGDCIVYEFDGVNNKVNKTIEADTQTFLGDDPGSKKSIAVTNLSFLQFLQFVSPPAQPRIVVHMRAQTQDPSSPGNVLEIFIQTTVSQRELNTP